tara:strand:- start:565 stop:978 length:414 start_codon:yes stop_codon:yes gene_type:complete
MEEEMDSKYEEDYMKEGMGKSYYEDDDLKEEKEETNEEFLRMQKLAGVISEEEYKTQVDELFGFGKKKRDRSGGSDSKGFAMFAYGKDGGKRRIGSGKTAQEARRDGDFQNYRRRYAVDKFEVVNLDNDQVVDTMKG